MNFAGVVFLVVLIIIFTIVIRSAFTTGLDGEPLPPGTKWLKILQLMTQDASRVRLELDLLPTKEASSPLVLALDEELMALSERMNRLKEAFTGKELPKASTKKAVRALGALLDERVQEVGEVLASRLTVQEKESLLKTARERGLASHRVSLITAVTLHQSPGARL